MNLLIATIMNDMKENAPAYLDFAEDCLRKKPFRWDRKNKTKPQNTVADETCSIPSDSVGFADDLL